MKVFPKVWNANRQCDLRQLQVVRSCGRFRWFVCNVQYKKTELAYQVYKFTTIAA